MSSVAIAVLLGCGMIFLSLLIFLVVYLVNNHRRVRETQYTVSDKELLLFINSQPDKIVDSTSLSDHFRISKSEAKSRLNYLQMNGLLSIYRSANGLKVYYTLSRSIDKPCDLVLSNEPFMTIEDLVAIFKYYDYKVSLQEICLATGLPIYVIKKEMKYFEKGKVVKRLLKFRNMESYIRIFTLQEPYRSDQSSYSNPGEMNFELKEMYQKVMRER